MREGARARGPNIFTYFPSRRLLHHFVREWLCSRRSHARDTCEIGKTNIRSALRETSVVFTAFSFTTLSRPPRLSHPRARAFSFLFKYFEMQQWKRKLFEKSRFRFSSNVHPRSEKQTLAAENKIIIDISGTTVNKLI